MALPVMAGPNDKSGHDEKAPMLRVRRSAARRGGAPLTARLR